MKAKHFLLTGLLFLGALVFTGCSKEAKIEKNLWKNGGVWNIDNYTYSSTTTNSTNGINLDVDDFGTITFNEGGTGTYTTSFFGNTDSGTLTYSNTVDQLTLALDGDSPIVYDMNWEKNEIIITNVTTTVDNGETTTETEIYTLSKS